MFCQRNEQGFYIIKIVKLFLNTCFSYNVFMHTFFFHICFSIVFSMHIYKYSGISYNLGTIQAYWLTKALFIKANQLQFKLHLCYMLFP